MKPFLDEPISDVSEDKFGLDQTAQILSQIIYEVEATSSYSIALTGSWGIGKSSVIRLAKKYLENSGYTIINFNPWVLNSEEKLIQEFFNSLSDKIEINEENLPLLKNLYLLSSAFAVSNKENIAIAGSLAAKKLRDRIKKIREDRKSIEIRKAIVATNLKASNLKLVIFIDDMDRSQPNEIKETLKLIKAIGNLPNIIYVTSYDRKAVHEALETIKINSHSYLNKIFNISIDIPTPKTSDLTDFLFSKLNTIFAEQTSLNFDNDRWNNIYFGILTQVVKTPRDVYRLCNDLIIVLKINPNVNVEDLIALQALKINKNNLYNSIYEYRKILTSVPSPISYKIELEKMLEKLSNSDASLMKEIIRLLFPGAHSALTGYPIDEKITSEWKRRLLVADISVLTAIFGQQANGEFEVRRNALSYSRADKSSLNALTSMNEKDFTELLNMILELNVFEETSDFVIFKSLVKELIKNLGKYRLSSNTGFISTSDEGMLLRLSNAILKSREKIEERQELLSLIYHSLASYFSRSQLLINFESNQILGELDENGVNSAVADLIDELSEEIIAHVEDVVSTESNSGAVMAFPVRIGKKDWKPDYSKLSDESLAKVVESLVLEEKEFERVRFFRQKPFDEDSINAIFGTIKILIDLLKSRSIYCPKFEKALEEVNNPK